MHWRLAAAIAGAAVCALATAGAHDLAPQEAPTANADQEAMFAHMKLRTSAGIVIFDTLNNADEERRPISLED